jgi:carbon-monoxide dehydrogenase medium subunit/6-hydroxypseudooxynicotine dehydrogenase subunit alpha
MKPPPFDYASVRTCDEALDLLAMHGDEAKILAGGQSLVPMLNFRLTRPAMLVDLNSCTELAGAIDDGKRLSIGAMTRQSVLERASGDGSAARLLAQAVRHVAHFQIRLRGTVGGSAAHADPSAELPVALAALDAEFVVRSRKGERRVAASDFFVGPYATALDADEMLTRIDIPSLRSTVGTAFVEFARRSGDYAVGGAAAAVALDPDGRCTYARLCLLGAAMTPLRAREAETSLTGSTLDDDAIAEAASLAVANIEPPSAGADERAYRRDVVRAMAARALVAAKGAVRA